MFDTLSVTLAAALATSGTLTVSYPAGRSRGDYQMGVFHKLTCDNGGTYTAPVDFELTLNASNITLTWRATGTLPINAVCRIDLDRVGSNDSASLTNNNIARAMQATGGTAPLALPAVAPGNAWITPAGVVIANFGSPAAASATALCTSQGVTLNVAAVINGARAFTINGVLQAVLDVPRNIVAAWTTTAVLTVTGYDVYGVAMSEASASGTSFTGKKAFKRVTSIIFSATVTGATVGTGSVLGMPFILPSIALVLKEIANLVAPTAGTFVVADLTKPTTTTGDPRGTWTPNTALDGSVGFQVVVASANPVTIVAQA